MPKFISFATAAVLMAALAGCAEQTAQKIPATDQQNYTMARELLAGSPALKAQIITECTAEVVQKTPEHRDRLAKLMNVSLARVPRVFCERLVNGLASGRLTVEDTAAVKAEQLTPNVIRVFQGR